MALITRLSRLFRADMHAVLDHMEEPDVLLRQAVREMEESLEKDASEIQNLQHELTRLEKHRAALTDQLVKLDSEIAVCFGSENDKLAKTFIRRRLETAALQKNTTDRMETLRDHLSVQQKRYTDQQLSYESIRQKSELIWREQQLRNKHAFQALSSGCPAVLEDDVELEFIRQKERFSCAPPSVKQESAQ